MSGLFTMAAGYQLAILQTAEVSMKAPLGGCVIHGDEGSIRAGSEGYEVHRGEGEVQTISYPEEALSSYAAEFEAFADHVAGTAEGPTTGVGERRSLAVVEAGYESAISGKPVNLVERFGDL